MGRGGAPASPIRSSDMKTIETERLRLRPFLWDDLAAVHRLLDADPEVAPWWTGRTRTLNEVRSSFVRKCEQPEGCPSWTTVVLMMNDN